MASTSAVSMAPPVPKMGHPKLPTFQFNPIRLQSTTTKTNSTARLEVKAASTSLTITKDKPGVAGLTAAAAAMAAVLLVPEIAEAAQPGVSPSLKNFLLSIGSGGVVVAVIVGAVVGVSNFDPVKRK